MDYNKLRGYLFIPSALVLVASNLLVLVGAIFFGWSIASVILLYWAESAVIGFYTILKMIFANVSPVELDSSWKIYIGNRETTVANLARFGPIIKFPLILFFMFHYGMFMFGHLIFIMFLVIWPFFLRAGETAAFDFLNLLTAVSTGLIVLFLSHGFSFVNNYLRKKEYQHTNVFSLMFSPYPRIFLMQFVIVIGSILMVSTSGPSFIFGVSYWHLAILVIGKTVFDLAAHVRERIKFELPKTSTRPALD